MTESEIRLDIKARLPHFFGKVGEVRFVEELEICAGKARADMAVISDQLIGIEIKGPKDKLDRLPNQVDQYSKCFDHVVLVVHELLAKEAMRIVPQWWGIVVGNNKNGANSYKLKRRPIQNRNVDVDSVLGLLWRDEIKALFADFLNLIPSVRASKREMRSQLLSAVPAISLKQAGIRLLRQRQEWRSLPIH